MNILNIISDFILKVKDLKVAVIGETIIDEFIDVEYEGMSMKSSCPALKLNGEKIDQEGGASIIANHLKDFVANVELFTNTGREIVKTRYVEKYSKQKHIEINRFDIDNFNELTLDTNDYDIVIVADFGHGFCDKLNINDDFYLMSQTNSYNFGYNRVSKWKSHSKRGVCIDKREASLQYNKKLDFNNDDDVFALYNYELNTKDLFITLGKRGAKYTNGDKVKNCPVFQSQIIDTIGAGDTFFAFACLASHIKMNPEKILIVPSLAASLSTTWVCNAENVTKQKLINHANRYL